MECPKCGVANSEDAERCRMCGSDLRPKKRPAGSEKACPFCNAVNERDALFCTSCNRPFGQQKGPSVDAIFGKDKDGKSLDRTYADAPSSALRAGRLGTAGILMLMISLWALLDIIFTMGLVHTAVESPEFDELKGEYPALKSFFVDMAVCSSIRVVFLVIVFVGAIASIQRINFMLSILGAIFALLLTMSSILALTWGIWLLVTGALFIAAIISILMITFSRREFMLT